jgi:hypothetical protein
MRHLASPPYAGGPSSRRRQGNPPGHGHQSSPPLRGWPFIEERAAGPRAGRRPPPRHPSAGGPLSRRPGGFNEAAGAAARRPFAGGPSSRPGQRRQQRRRVGCLAARARPALHRGQPALTWHPVVPMSSPPVHGRPFIGVFRAYSSELAARLRAADHRGDGNMLMYGGVGASLPVRCRPFIEACAWAGTAASTRRLAARLWAALHRGEHKYGAIGHEVLRLAARSGGPSSTLVHHVRVRVGRLRLAAGSRVALQLSDLEAPTKLLVPWLATPTRKATLHRGTSVSSATSTFVSIPPARPPAGGPSSRKRREQSRSLARPELAARSGGPPSRRAPVHRHQTGRHKLAARSREAFIEARIPARTASPRKAGSPRPFAAALHRGAAITRAGSRAYLVARSRALFIEARRRPWSGTSSAYSLAPRSRGALHRGVQWHAHVALLLRLAACPAGGPSSRRRPAWRLQRQDRGSPPVRGRPFIEARRGRTCRPGGSRRSPRVRGPPFIEARPTRSWSWTVSWACRPVRGRPFIEAAPRTPVPSPSP